MNKKKKNKRISSCNRSPSSLLCGFKVKITISVLHSLLAGSPPSCRLKSENGFIPSILEQSCWSENYSFLGTYRQLGICCCWASRHEQATRNDIWQHDRSNVRLFSTVHEICMDGATPQLSTSCLSCIE